MNEAVEFDSLGKVYEILGAGERTVMDIIRRSQGMDLESLRQRASKYAARGGVDVRSIVPISTVIPGKRPRARPIVPSSP